MSGRGDNTWSGFKTGVTEEASGNYNQIHFIVSYYSHWLVGVKIYSQSFEGFNDYNKQQIMNEPTTDQFLFLCMHGGIDDVGIL